jgi:hypothetical protein
VYDVWSATQECPDTFFADRFHHFVEGCLIGEVARTHQRPRSATVRFVFHRFSDPMDTLTHNCHWNKLRFVCERHCRNRVGILKNANVANDVYRFIRLAAWRLTRGM